MEGDYDKALKYYTAAAQSGSSEAAIVTLDRSWRGKPVVDMAAEGAKRVRERMEREQSLTAQVGRLNLRGVSALNRNSLYEARQFFEQAYKLDPNNAFVLNNRGFLAEMDGDPESASFFYEKARRAGDANTRVGFANNQGAGLLIHDGLPPKTGGSGDVVYLRPGSFGVRRFFVRATNDPCSDGNPATCEFCTGCSGESSPGGIIKSCVCTMGCDCHPCPAC